MFEQLVEAIARGLERLGIPLVAYEKQALKRVRRVLLGGAKVCFASLEDLIIHKVLAGRPRDLEDVRSILLKNQAFDLEYVQRWLREFDRSLGEKSLERFDEVRQSPPKA